MAIVSSSSSFSAFRLHRTLASIPSHFPPAMAKLSCVGHILLLVLLLSCVSSFASSIPSFDGMSRGGGGGAADVPWQSCAMGDCDQEVSPRRVLAASYSYISYGALTANRVPCPPQSGRSYYSANCNTATGTANPYSRSCSAITRCQRSTS